MNRHEEIEEEEFESDSEYQREQEIIKEKRRNIYMHP